MAAEIINATINASINESMNQSLHGSAYFKSIFLPEMFGRIWDLISAPAKVPEMIWIVVPLIVSLLVMTIYFGRYKTEALGWNTAVGNTLVLVFVSIDLLRHIYNNPHIENPLMIGGFGIPIKTLVAILVMLQGFTLLYANFLHWLPEKIAFFITSALPVNLTAYVAITIVYSDIPFNWMTLVAALVLFLILFGFFQLIKITEWKLWGDTHNLKKKK